MEYLNTIISLLSPITKLEQIVALATFAIMFIVFIVEIIFYFIKKPRGLSNMILIVGIIGMFCILFITLFQSSSPITQITPQLSKQLFISVLTGLTAAVLAGLLAILESIFELDKPEQTLTKSIRDLMSVLKDNQQTISRGIQTQIKAQDIQYISKQIYDLTHHLKHEHKLTRENNNKFLDKLREQSQNRPTQLNKPAENSKQSLSESEESKTIANKQDKDLLNLKASK